MERRSLQPSSNLHRLQARNGLCFVSFSWWCQCSRQSVERFARLRSFAPNSIGPHSRQNRGWTCSAMLPIVAPLSMAMSLEFLWCARPIAARNFLSHPINAVSTYFSRSFSLSPRKMWRHTLGVRVPFLCTTLWHRAQIGRCACDAQQIPSSRYFWHVHTIVAEILLSCNSNERNGWMKWMSRWTIVNLINS